MNVIESTDLDAIEAKNLDCWLQDWTSPVPTTNQGAESLAFQRWFHFKEAFSPTFVVDAIQRQPKPPKKVLDVFSGSGTTALTCQFLGIQPIAIEVNPFLADLTQAKLEVYNIPALHDALRKIERKAKSLRNSDLLARFPLPPTFVEPGKGERWLFNHEAALALLSYRAAIESLDDPVVQRLGRVVLGSMLVPTSNAFINGKGRRYRKNWKDRSPLDIDAIFHESFRTATSDAVLTLGKPQRGYTLLRGDARQKIDDVTCPVDLALFSPPYPNSFDYTDVYNIELWMLGYLQNPEDNRRLRTDTLRSHVQISRDFAALDIGSTTLRKVIRALHKQENQLWDKKIPQMIAAYFDDLVSLIGKIQGRLSDHGRIEVVVGDSMYCDVLVPVAKILAEAAPHIGLQVESVKAVRAMRASAQQGGQLRLDESLVVLSKRH